MSALSDILHVGMLGSVLVMAATGQACAQSATSEGNDVASILSRPLFEPDREPRGRALAQAGTPQVVGISGHPGDWRAIIRTGGPGSRGKLMAAGEKIGDWSIADISAAEVVLKNGQSVRHLSPVFTKYAPQASPQKQGETLQTKPVAQPHAAKATFHFDPASGEVP